MRAKIPGFQVLHLVVTPACRQSSGDEGAWVEAIAQAKEVYDGIVAGWAGLPNQPTLRLALTVEYPKRGAPENRKGEHE